MRSWSVKHGTSCCHYPSCRGASAPSRWSRQIAHTRTRDRERDALEDALGEVAEAWVHPLDAYQFPVVTLAETAGVEAVCRMFERLNGTGVKLGPL